MATERTEDAVDRNVEQWRRVRPDLPLDAMATFARLGRLAGVATPLIGETFARFGLSIGEFDVLAALRRAGDPYTLTPSALARGLMLSAAAMTNRLDRLEAAGALTRRLDPANRRSMLVTLTAAGLDVVDRAVTEHVAREEELLGVLGAADRRRLDALLRDLLHAWESRSGTGGSPAR
ncbi:MarR family winged helix-turn-helix transcriptional regulator [Nakamurella endophytica]|uniref:MarR family winged helix-turn-helix transcriptional regulator n=1 Tax=Nakamurella endophytica TaxID=1748367 RepID=UPI001E3C7FEF|nr:MarR family transcriptional regulator [Nakamurella endophytica]